MKKIRFIPNRGLTNDEKQLWKALGLATPIIPAKDFIPNWFKNLPKVYVKDNDLMPTAKRCPGIFDFCTAGYILPMWADCYFKWVEEDKWEVKAADIFNTLREPISSHDFDQATNAPFFEDSCTSLIKLNSPWYVEVPKGISLFYTHPFYHASSDFTVCPGIIDPEIDNLPNKEVNCIFRLNKKEKLIRINRGDPLMQIIPFTREPYGLDISLPTDEEQLQMDITKIKYHAHIQTEQDSKLRENRIKKEYNAR